MQRSIKIPCLINPNFRVRRALSLVLVFNVIVKVRKLRKNIKIQKLKEES